MTDNQEVRPELTDAEIDRVLAQWMEPEPEYDWHATEDYPYSVSRGRWWRRRDHLQGSLGYQQEPYKHPTQSLGVVAEVEKRVIETWGERTLFVALARIASKGRTIAFAPARQRALACLRVIESNKKESKCQPNN